MGKLLKAVIQVKIQTFGSYFVGTACKWSFRRRRRISQDPALVEILKHWSIPSDS